MVLYTWYEKGIPPRIYSPRFKKVYSVFYPLVTLLYFQCYINETLEGLRDLKCLTYLDDILVYGKTFDEQLENLEAVLMKLRSKGIKLNVSNCNFFKQKVKYLGRIISKDGHQAYTDDAVALKNFRKPPKTVEELRSRLGFLGYYRGYVKNFSIILKPFYDY